MTAASPYVGRFAPSPTGPLHFGSLLAAVASYLEARRHGGLWLVRIEDIDPPRAQPDADRLIIQALERYGFEWDGEIIYQSQSADAHREAIERLQLAGHLYRCGCSRRDLADVPTGSLGTIYPGTCRNGSDASEFALRVRTSNQAGRFDDRLQGRQVMRLESESGDYVVLRRDGLIAYQLAVVVDHFEQGVTDVVRGIDLMDSTPRQIWLQQLLGYPSPSYAHIPVAVDVDGVKLSKNTGASGIPLTGIGATLVAALATLRQRPPNALANAEPDEIWRWATSNWDLSVLEGKQALAAPSAMAQPENGLS